MHAAASERASATNNDGLYAQVHYLMRGSDHSWRPAEVLFAARSLHVEGDDDDIESDQAHMSPPISCYPGCPACAEENGGGA